jgi:predicted O-methyltransferase YrrM
MSTSAPLKQRFQTAARVGLERIGLQRRAEQIPDLEPAFRDLHARCSPYTMTSVERMYAVYQAAGHVARAGIAGDYVECGVWRGGSSMMAALALAQAGDGGRTMWLYDTFEGMSEPTAEDAPNPLEAADVHDQWARNETGDHNDWCYAPLDEVRANMRSAGVGDERLKLVKGKVEDTIPGAIPERIALLRLDTDWYESTRHELEHLYPLLQPGGVLIIDDYGHWPGARRAVDEYLAAQGVQLLLGRIDNSGRIAVKPGA